MTRYIFAWLIAAAAICGLPDNARAQGGVVHTVDQLSEAPKLVSPTRAAEVVRAAFPDALRQKGVSGMVQVTFIVDEAGKVEAGSVKVIAAAPAELGPVASQIVPKLEFKPGKKDGTAVRTQVRMPLAIRP